MAVSTVSYTTTPQAADDLFTALMTGLTEDALGNVTLNVMANDLGGKAKSLYSVDDGSSEADLLARDTARSAGASADLSLNGARIWITADGLIGYDASTLSNAFKFQLQSLGAGETLEDSFTYSIQLGNGTISTATAVVRIAGVNDAPVITSAPQTGTVEEDEQATASGQVTASDVDHNDHQHYSLLGAGSGAYGSFNVDAGGAWSYTLDNGSIQVQSLKGGESHVETFVVRVSDDAGAYADQSVQITVVGTNDLASISGSAAGSLSEDAVSAATGTLAVADVDTGEAHTTAASGSSSLGAWSVDADGNWSYAVNNAAVQHLTGTASTSDSFSVSSLDGTATQLVSITINGLNDAASITGTSSGTVVEAGSGNGGGTPTVSADLLAADVDDGQADAFQAVLDPAASVNGYGTFTVSMSGVWSYTLDNSHAAVNALGNGGSLADSFSVTSLDGTATQVVSITIQGATDNQPPVITSGATGSAAENSPIATVAYQATATDPDGGLLAWSLDGSDAALFNISAGGAVTFKASPNFEAPADSGANNVYDINVIVIDPLGASDAQAVAISVGNVSEPAVIGNDFNFLQSGTTLQITLNGGTQSFAGFFGGGHSGTNTFALGDGNFASFSGNSFSFPAGASFHGFALAGSYTVNQGLSGINGPDIIASSNLAQTSDGGNGNDIVFGNGGNDSLTGSQGNDLLLGGAGNDSINGANSSDVLVGGAGNDTLTGGSGDDRFVFLSAADGKDNITDFNVSNDELDLRDVLSGFVPGSSAIGDFVKLTVAGGSTTLSVDADGSTGPDAFVDLAVLQGVTGLSLSAMYADGILIV